jgi:RNA polymerase sigma factor (sigma-70 family)
MNKVEICGVNTATLPKISKEESESLLKQIKQGSESAKERFITSNIRLVLSIIKRFPTAKVSEDDMFQAGCIGLIKATENFDLKYGVMFSTYAVPMILGEIKRLLRTNNSLRVSRSIRDTAYQVLKTRGELEKTDIIDARNFRLIPFTTIKNGGALPAFSADKVRIFIGKSAIETSGIYIGVTEKKIISGGYSALIGTPFFDATETCTHSERGRKTDYEKSI